KTLSFEPQDQAEEGSSGQPGGRFGNGNDFTVGQNHGGVIARIEAEGVVEVDLAELTRAQRLIVVAENNLICASTGLAARPILNNQDTVVVPCLRGAIGKVDDARTGCKIKVGIGTQGQGAKHFAVSCGVPGSSSQFHGSIVFNLIAGAQHQGP